MSKLHKQRIDNLLVIKGLAESRAKAQAMLMAGEVLAGGRTVLKAGTLVPEDVDIAVTSTPAFVGRGGYKLEYALEQFKIDVNGKTVADIGSSTGGFTDCLLQRGAKRVYAVDVGTNQLDYRLRIDRRVIVMEGINARYPFALPEKVDMATLDLSFISVEKVIPVIMGLLMETGCMVILLKPQFEARRDEVGKGGVIKDRDIHARVLGRFIKYVVNKSLRLCGIINSPIFGSSGNREFLILISGI